jgi:CBS domain-containing protein
MKVMLIEEVVRDRGSDELYSVAASATVGDAVDEMAQREIGAVLVMNEEQLVAGIFTERDLLMRVVRPGLDTRTTPLSLVMTRDLCFVSPGTTVEAAMALMHLRKLRHLLVIDGPVVHGLVSMRDLVYQVVRHGQEWAEEAARGAALTSTTGSPLAQPDTL